MDQVHPIPFAPGYYVSEDGQVFSGKRGAFRQLKSWANEHGHRKLRLSVGGEGVTEYVHRLVAITFIGPPPEIHHEIRHLDGDPTNNAVWNLAWGTHKENMQDAVRHGRHISQRHPERMARGERHGSKTKPERVARGRRNASAVLDESSVRLIRVRLHTERVRDP